MVTKATEPGPWRVLCYGTSEPVSMRRARLDLGPGLEETITLPAEDAAALALALRDGTPEAVERLRGLMREMS